MRASAVAWFSTEVPSQTFGSGHSKDMVSRAQPWWRAALVAIAAGDDAEAAMWLTLEEMAALPLAGSVYDIALRVAARTPCARQDSRRQAGS